MTSCRPSEAAHIVYKNSLRRNDYPDFKDCDFVATMPKEVTKTHLDYKWPIPRKKNLVVDLLRLLHKHSPSLEKELGPADQFQKSMTDFYQRRVLKEAEEAKKGVTAQNEAGHNHCFRTIRAWHWT